MAHVLEWSCLEVDCDYAAVAEHAEVLVSAVMDHARTAHGSFELEEMILAAVEERDPAAVPAGLVDVGGVRVAPRWAAAHDPARLSAEGRRSMEWSPTRGYADL